MNLSRAIDGDLPAAERAALVDSLLTDPELAQRWQRYHAIGDLMRDASLGVDLTARVRAQIDADPTMDRSGVGETVVHLTRPLRRSGWTCPPAFGLALAASVAVATVVGLRTLMPGVEPDPAVAVVRPATDAPTQALLEGTPTASAQGNAVAAAPAPGRAPGGGNGIETVSGQFLVPQGGSPALGAASQAAPALPQARLSDFLERHQRRAQSSMLLNMEQAPLTEKSR